MQERRFPVLSIVVSLGLKEGVFVSLCYSAIVEKLQTCAGKEYTCFFVCYWD